MVRTNSRGNSEVTEQPTPGMVMAQDEPWAFLPQADSAGAQHPAGRFGVVSWHKTGRLGVVPWH